MTLQALLSNAIRFMEDIGLDSGFRSFDVRNMAIMKTPMTKMSSCSVVEPLVGLVLQGSKAAQYGTESVRYHPGDVVVIGQALPMTSALIDASVDEPYIALYISLDLNVLRSVYNDMGGSAQDNAGPALASGAASPEIIDSVARMFNLNGDPAAEQTLGEAALREVYFWVLRSDQGDTLRRVIRADSKANQITKAIAHIRREYRNTIKASDLAAIAGMSASVFYDAFKQTTANSPLQFQKDLRLTDAHQMLQQTSSPISEIAYSVGYESAAQFSREFSKKFGASPKAFANMAHA